MKKYLFIVFGFLLMLNLNAKSQGINFVDCNFNDALELARSKNLNLFVDVYADWCGPCKMLSEQVFPQTVVGSFFNERFISCKINADDKENANLMKKYEITGLPTLLFISSDGTLLEKVVGMMNPYALVRSAKIALHDKKTPDELYEMYKKDKKNFAIQQELLMDVPYFIPSLEGTLKDRWLLRIKSMYSDYIKDKTIDSMINETDFNIITIFHEKMEKNDEIIDFMVSHADQYNAVLPENVLSQYITGMHSNLVMNLARTGDEDYSDVAMRIKGDLRPFYAVFTPEVDAYYASYNLVAKANYALYAKKDISQYNMLMDEFLGEIDKPTINDYASCIETVFNATKGKLPAEACEKCILWIDAALKLDVNVETQTGMVVTMGDCFLGLKNTEKARECYNQAYMLSLKSENVEFTSQIQTVIKQKLSTL